MGCNTQSRQPPRNACEGAHNVMESRVSLGAFVAADGAMTVLHTHLRLLAESRDGTRIALLNLGPNVSKDLL